MRISRLRLFPLMLSVGAVVLLGLVLAALYFAVVAGRQSDKALTAAKLNSDLIQLFSSLQDAETGQRGFVLTGEEQYLQPFEQSNEALLSRFVELRPKLAEVGIPDTTLQRLSDLLVVKLDELRTTIDLVRRGQRPEALRIVRTDSGRIAMVEIRRITAEIDRLTDAYATEQIDRMKSTTTGMSSAMAVGAVVILLFVGAAVAVVFEHSRQLERTRRALEEANDTLEAKVAERTEGLERANTELQSYAYIVSHDLRAPLVNIMGFTEELEQASKSFAAYLGEQGVEGNSPAARTAVLAVKEDIPEALRFIRTSIQRMDVLISEILKLARAGTRQMKPEPIDMRELVEENIVNLQHRLDQAGAEVGVASGLPAIVSDRLALQQIFGNLLDNAVKYLDPARPGRISVSGKIAGGDAEFRVTDNGRGIAAADNERVFELFRRSGAQDRPGEGVGLAHVRALARRLGGDVTVSSTLGKGTEFVVKLPADMRSIKRRSDT